MLLKSISVVGVAYRMSAVRDPEANRHDFEWLFAAYSRGALRPRIGARFPLEQAAQALRQVGERSAIGKIIVDVSNSA